MDNVTRKGFLAASSLGIISALGISACSYTPAQPTLPLTLLGAFHPLTGTSEPTEFNSGLATPEEIVIGTENLKSDEQSSDTKTLFIFAEAKADGKKNLEVGASTPLSTGEWASDAKLTVDGTNEYNDNYTLNKRGYFQTLADMGFHDGATGGELYANSPDTYKAVFLFFVGNNDLENGEKAHLEWGDFELDINLSEVKEVNSPADMIADLDA